MGGASSVFLTPELCQKLTEKSIIEFHQFETDCISRNLSADEIHDSLSTKYEALLLRDNDFSSFPKSHKPLSPTGKKGYNRNNNRFKQQSKSMNISVSLKNLPSESKGSNSRRLHSSTASSRQRVTRSSNKWDTTVDNATKAKQRAELRSKIYQQYSSLPTPRSSKVNPSTSRKSSKLDENRAFGGSSTSALRRIPQSSNKTAVRTGSMETMPTIDNNDHNSQGLSLLLASSMSCDDLSTLGGVPYLDSGESCISYDLQDDHVEYSPNPYFQFKSMDENDINFNNDDEDGPDHVVVGFHDENNDDEIIETPKATNKGCAAVSPIREEGSLIDLNSSVINNNHYECRLCRRKFNSSLLLETHIAFSQVHRQALEELRARYSKGHEEADRLGKLLRTTVERFQRSLLARKAHLEGRISIAKLRWRQAIGKVIASFVTKKYNALLSTLNRPLLSTAAATTAGSGSGNGSKGSAGPPLLVLQQSRFFWRTNGRFVFNVYLHSFSDPTTTEVEENSSEGSAEEGGGVRRVLEIVPQLLPSDPTRPSTAMKSHANLNLLNKSMQKMTKEAVITAITSTNNNKEEAEEGTRFYLDLDLLRQLIKRQNQRHDQLQHQLSDLEDDHDDEYHHKYRLSEISSLARAAISSDFLTIDYQRVLSNPSTQAKALIMSFPLSSKVQLVHRPGWITQPAIISLLRLYHGKEVAMKLEEVRQGQLSLRDAVNKADELASAAHAALTTSSSSSPSKGGLLAGKSSGGLLRLSPRMLVILSPKNTSNGGGPSSCKGSKGHGKSFRFSSSLTDIHYHDETVTNISGSSVDLLGMIDASMTQSFAIYGKTKPAMLS